MSKFGDELLESARDALEVASGKKLAARSHVPTEVDVASVRRRTGLSQQRFSERFGIPVATLRDWEQHRRSPDQTARVLLSVIEKEPAAVERALRTATGGH